MSETPNGASITTFCDDHALTTKERVGLFVRAAEAVHEGRERGVVYASLGPESIRVTGGATGFSVEVVDGATASDRDQGSSPDPSQDAAPAASQGAASDPTNGGSFASPEQTGIGETVDARSDVYRLGMVLYELLAGSLPNLAELAASEGATGLLRGRDMPPPSAWLCTLGTQTKVARLRGTTIARLRRELHGELDEVVLKAINEDRARRYASVPGLTGELEEYLGRSRLASFALQHRLSKWRV